MGKIMESRLMADYYVIYMDPIERKSPNLGEPMQERDDQTFQMHNV